MNTELLNIARAFVEKMRMVHEDRQYQSIWGLAHAHGISYTGPTYEKELKALEDIIANMSSSNVEYETDEDFKRKLPMLNREDI